ncbi:stage III sporulation protein AF [Bacillus sp. FJAT-45037]|uniref:stage III sporulation protein AF n=1 Tax=Bacillus sp. FJAT-45037 TaxID=2011007 RepID=UPI0012FDB146|nr:stage III sporulation protein AF [Bacillus sp. FJAT-45037]
MGFITEWLTNIILLILLATILELMLPNSVMQRYVKMVVGLLLLVMILQPLLSIFTEDVDEWLFSLTRESDQLERTIEHEINLQKSGLELGLRAYISEQMAVQLESEVDEELGDQFALEITRVDVQMRESANQTPTAEDVEVVIVGLRDKNQPQDGTSNETAVTPVSVVSIDATSPLPTEGDEEVKDLTAVHQFLSANWEVPKEMILLAWEGGE